MILPTAPSTIANSASARPGLPTAGACWHSRDPLPRSARAWTGNGTPREARGLTLRPDGAIRNSPIPPQLVRLLRHRLRATGAPQAGGCSGVPAAARSAKASAADLASGPRRGHRPGRHPAGPRPASCVMPRCRHGQPPAPRPPKSLPAPGGACVSCSPPTPTAYPAAIRSPASRSSKPSAPGFTCAQTCG